MYVRWPGCSLPCARCCSHVFVLVTYGFVFWVRTVAEKESWNFLSILLPKSFDFCLELCYDICVKRKEIPSCGLMGEDSMREKDRRKTYNITGGIPRLIGCLLRRIDKRKGRSGERSFRLSFLLFSLRVLVNER